MKNKSTLTALSLLLMGALSATQPALAQGGYVAGDFHQHTTYTDGSYTIGKMMEMNNKFGLDWWANSEHGGKFTTWGLVTGVDLGTSVNWSNTGIAIQGDATTGGNMWRWQSIKDWSYRDVQLWRRVLPNKLILQGYEMNVPGHEHASTCIINNQFDVADNANPVAQFEYMFDNNDGGTTNPYGWVKSTKTGHEKAVEAMTWLQTNYRTTSWVIPAHPERYVYNGSTGWNINHFRDLNNAAPDVFFGFESIPGHQKSTNRGEYASTRPSYGTSPYGGAGKMTAQVGGLWDALLSEGRHFWVFANSDCHNNETSGGDFFPGEYQKNYTYVTKKNDAQAIVDGLRSGNTYCVMGDLIDNLDFKVETAVMGSTLNTTNNTVTVTIRLRDPQTINNNRYGTLTNPTLDHVDIIAGVCTGLIAPTAPQYTVDNVTTTKVVARFATVAGAVDASNITTQAWTAQADGYKEISFTYPIADGQKIYFRLRGTNQPVNQANETDASGNPLIDTEGQNSAAKAFEDLWFYSNPIFVQNTIPAAAQQVMANEMQITPNPATDIVEISFAQPQQGVLNITNINGVVVKSTVINNETDVYVVVSDLASGVYSLTINNITQKLIIK